MLNKCVIGFLKAKLERNNLGFSMSVEIFKIAKKHSIKKNLHQILLEWTQKMGWVELKIFRN
ncbi:hypothetical protein VN1284_02430 [Helicobacter pylori]|nr:hypothetical protein VN1284_02430 [Helicobacter pylori]